MEKAQCLWPDSSLPPEAFDGSTVGDPGDRRSWISNRYVMGRAQIGWCSRRWCRSQPTSKSTRRRQCYCLPFCLHGGRGLSARRAASRAYLIYDFSRRPTYTYIHNKPLRAGVRPRSTLAEEHNLLPPPSKSLGFRIHAPDITCQCRKDGSTTACGPRKSPSVPCR